MSEVFLSKISSSVKKLLMPVKQTKQSSQETSNVC